jgi:hypothetical protein
MKFLSFEIVPIVELFKRMKGNNDTTRVEYLDSVTVFAYLPHKAGQKAIGKNGQKILGRKGDDNFVTLMLNEFTLNRMKLAIDEMVKDGHHPLNKVFEAIKTRSSILSSSYVNTLIEEDLDDHGLEGWLLNHGPSIEPKQLRNLVIECAGKFLKVCELDGIFKYTTEEKIPSLFGSSYMPIHKAPKPKKQKV